MDLLLVWMNSFTLLKKLRTGVAESILSPFTLTTTKSVITVKPTTSANSLFASGLQGPEGLGFAAGGLFPLFVAEEDAAGMDLGRCQIGVDGLPERFAPDLER